ncbi:NAD(P)-dependent oxidoreductase [Sphingobacterium suaedae]|uniref:NAD(P)-dependent oxidoreductase n=1 Tax=Sphingobacterium suaedae TaxID=1686402 RepID=A0ABW5KD62_9SPHI
MKNSAIFVDTARRAIYQEDDLIHALRTNEIGGAGLDVSDPEPMLQTELLLRLSGVCMLPPIESATKQTRTQMTQH